MLEVKYIKRIDEDKQKEAIGRIVTHFNNLAVGLGSKYRIVSKGDSAYLIQYAWIVGDRAFFENYCVKLNYDGKRFNFENVNEDILNDVEYILIKIPDKLYAEVEYG